MSVISGASTSIPVPVVFGGADRDTTCKGNVYIFILGEALDPRTFPSDVYEFLGIIDREVIVRIVHITGHGHHSQGISSGNANA